MGHHGANTGQHEANMVQNGAKMELSEPKWSYLGYFIGPKSLTESMWPSRLRKSEKNVLSHRLFVSARSQKYIENIRDF